MSHISEKSAFEAFARMEEKIDANERKVRASAEIEDEFSGDKLANDLEYVALPEAVKALVRKQWGEIKDANGKVVDNK